MHWLIRCPAGTLKGISASACMRLKVVVGVGSGIACNSCGQPLEELRDEEDSAGRPGLSMTRLTDPFAAGPVWQCSGGCLHQRAVAAADVLPADAWLHLRLRRPAAGPRGRGAAPHHAGNSGDGCAECLRTICGRGGPPAAAGGPGVRRPPAPVPCPGQLPPTHCVQQIRHQQLHLKGTSCSLQGRERGCVCSKDNSCQLWPSPEYCVYNDMDRESSPSMTRARAGKPQEE